MALYWYGGSGNWSDYTNHWSNNSGNSPSSPASAAPTANDDVIFDTNSGSGTVTINGTSSSRSICRDITFSSSSLTTVSGASNSYWNVYGSMTLQAGLTWSMSGNIYFKATSGKNLTSAGANLSTFYIDGVGGSLTLQDSLTMASSSQIYVQNGTFITNNQTVAAGTSSYFGISTVGSATSGLQLGSSSIVNCTTFSIENANCTVSSNTSSFTFTYTSVTTRVISPSTGSTIPLYDYTWTSTGSTIPAFHGAAGTSFRNLSITSYSTSGTVSIYGPITVTGTLTLTGPAINERIAIIGMSSTDYLSTSQTITAAAVSLTNVDFSGITGAGAATWSGTSIGDGGRNTNISFTTPKTSYWVGNTGSWYDSTNHWSDMDGGSPGLTNYPICHDTVIFNAASFSATSTVTISRTALINEIDLSNVDQVVTLSISGGAHLLGDLIIKSDGTLSGSNSFYFLGSSAQIFNTNGATVSASGTAQIYGAVTIGAALTASSLSIQTWGSDASVDLDIYDVTLKTLKAYASSTIRLGTGTLTLAGTGSVLTTEASVDFDAESSTIIISDTTSTSKTFGYSNETYNNVTITGDNITIAASNTFSSLSLNNAGLTNGTKFTAGTTQTVTTLSMNGSVGNLVKIGSSSTSLAYISKASGEIDEDYLSISYISLRGAAKWFAGKNSTDGGNNQGIVFDIPQSCVDYYSEGNYDSGQAIRGTAMSAIGQSFEGNGGTIITAKFYIRKQGSPTGNAYAKVYEHSGTFGTDSLPTGDAIAVSGAFDVSTLTTTSALASFTFSGANRISLTNGVYYVLVFEYTGGDGSNYVDFGQDWLGMTHSGNGCTYTSSTWSTSTTDQIFYLFQTITYTKTVTAKGDILNTATRTVTAKGDIKQQGITQTLTGKGRILTLGIIQTTTTKGDIKTTETQEATAKGDIQKTKIQTSNSKSRVLVIEEQTVETTGNIRATITQTVTSLGYLSAMVTKSVQSIARIVGIFEMAQPSVEGTLIPFPSRATIRKIQNTGEYVTLMGKKRKDITGEKYQYVMEWDVLSSTYYNAIEELIRSGEPFEFKYAKWPQSSDGIEVHARITERTHVTGTGTTDYWSSVGLTLTEENWR